MAMAILISNPIDDN